MVVAVLVFLPRSKCVMKQWSVSIVSDYVLDSPYICCKASSILGALTNKSIAFTLSIIVKRLFFILDSSLIELMQFWNKRRPSVVL